MDLSLGQTEWNELFKRWGLLIRIWSWLKEYAQFKMITDRVVGSAPFATLSPSTLTDMKEDGPTLVVMAKELAITGLPILSNWALSGVKFDSNTDANGTIYVKAVTDAYGSAITVSLYKDIAESNLVASGSGAADETITLNEQNASGLSGSVYAGSFSGAIQTDRYYLRCRPDWKRRLQQAFETGTAEDARLLSVGLSQLSDNADTIEDMIGDWEDFIETEFIKVYIKAKMQSVSDDVISVTESQSGGTVTISYEGILADLKENMEDETSPSAQAVRNNTPTASAAVPGPGNVGSGSVTISTLYDHAKSGRVVLKCVDETFGSEYFEVKWVPDNWWEFDDITASYNAYVNAIYANNDIGIAALTIERDVSESGDGQGVFSSWAFNGESDSNTDSGVLYVKYISSGDHVYVYKDAGLGASDLVASGSGTGTVSLAAENSSGLTGSVTVVHQGSDDDSITLTLSQFKEDDSFTFTITETKTGLIQKYVGDVYNFDLPFAALDSETIADYYARRG